MYINLQLFINHCTSLLMCKETKRIFFIIYNSIKKIHMIKFCLFRQFRNIKEMRILERKIYLLIKFLHLLYMKLFFILRNIKNYCKFLLLLYTTKLRNHVSYI